MPVRRRTECNWHARANQIAALGGKEIRGNEALVDAAGRKISNLRPDIQYIGRDGKVHIEEVIDTHRIQNREDDLRVILGEQFGSYIEYDVVL